MLTSPPLPVEWHRFDWHSMEEELDSGRFDFAAEPVYRTPSRELLYEFCTPMQFFDAAIAVVGQEETRFKVFDDLDRPDITIVLDEDGAPWSTR